MEARMRSALLALLLSATAAAQTLSPCPDNGESSSRRTIRPDSGKALTEVPAHWRERAQRAWSMDYVSKDHPEPATGVHATVARVFRFPRATFYLVTVNGEQGLFSDKCPIERCSEWWTDGTLVANRDHPPAAVPGDEFYLRRANQPEGQAVLVQADPMGALYVLAERCIVTLTVRTK
jgi:hypothetical protein